MQKALQKESLDAVNKVLAKMEVEDAEEIVEKLQMSGILHFSMEGVKDVTGKDGEEEEEEIDTDEVFEKEE